MENMSTDALPPNTGFKVASALICRRLVLSCRLFFLMYAHSRFVISVRGIGLEPTTAASVSLGVTGRMKAALGVRALFFFGAAAFRDLAAAFGLAAGFFLAVFAMQSPLQTLQRVDGEYHESSSSTQLY